MPFISTILYEIYSFLNTFFFLCAIFFWKIINTKYKEFTGNQSSFDNKITFENSYSNGCRRRTANYEAHSLVHTENAFPFIFSAACHKTIRANGSLFHQRHPIQSPEMVIRNISRETINLLPWFILFILIIIINKTTTNELDFYSNRVSLTFCHFRTI